MDYRVHEYACHRIDCNPLCHRGAKFLGIYSEQVFVLRPDGAEAYSRLLYGTRLRNITVFAKNIGPTVCRVRLQNSPDGIEFTNDPQVLTLAQGEIKYVVPYIFSRFIRVVAESPGAGDVIVWAQMQKFGYSEDGRGMRR